MKTAIFRTRDLIISATATRIKTLYSIFVYIRVPTYSRKKGLHKLSPCFPISMEVTRSRETVLTLGFRRIWRTFGENFHDAAMNGCDWPALRAKYEAAAGLAGNPRD